MRTLPNDRYLADKVQTATPAQLVGMLFDAGLVALRGALADGPAPDVAGWNRRLLKAQDVVLELRCSLNKDAGELATNLDRLYDYVWRRLVDANVRKDTRAVHECLAILEPIRDAWREACLQAAPVEALAS